MTFPPPVQSTLPLGDHRHAPTARNRAAQLSRAFTVTALALVVAFGGAPTAAADEASYLQRVHVRYMYLSRPQLLTEGYKICQYVSGGRASSLAVPMVSKDLGVSVPAAANIIAAAVVELGC
jgi:hypothetical protein